MTVIIYLDNSYQNNFYQDKFIIIKKPVIIFGSGKISELGRLVKKDQYGLGYNQNILIQEKYLANHAIEYLFWSNK